MRLGDLDALRKNMEFICMGVMAGTEPYNAPLTEIDNAPTVEERPQGEWIKVKEERMSVDMSGEIVTRYKCSKCGRIIATFPNKLVEYYPFCHCGAKMKGGAENE